MIFIVLFSIFAIVIIIYNIILKKLNKVNESYATLDVYLKKRYDLVPNLINCVQGYSKYEARILSDFLSSRTENYSSEMVNDIIVNFENYPSLKADKLFLNLQHSLYDIEEQISAARRNYNACVNDYNNFICYFPINFFSYLFRFKKCKLYSIDEIEKRVVDVSEGFRKVL